MVNRVSNTGVGITSPIVVYEDSKEANDVANNYLKIYPARILSSTGKTSDSLYVSSVDVDDLEVADDTAQKNTVALANNKTLKKAPTLMDIELVSNTVVYDAAGNPTSTVVFKVRNSSGEAVKSVNARVKVL